MTTVLTRVIEIFNRERFDIIVTRKGKPINTRSNGMLGPYPFKRKLKDSATVNDWRRDRFEASYPGYSCDVLTADGKNATGQTKLKTVRSGY